MNETKLYTGLYNNGTTDYVNATVQSLLHTETAKNAILNLPLVRNGDKDFVFELQALFQTMMSTTSPSVGTRDMCLAFGMTPLEFGVQYDAAEFFKRVIEKISERAHQIDFSQNTDFAVKHMKTFCGNQLQVVTCTACGHQSVTNYAFTDILLTITPSLFDSLSKMRLPEIIDNYMCRSCKQKVLVTMNIAMNEIPAVVVMTASLFIMDKTGQLIKDQNPTDFPFAIDLTFLNALDIQASCSNDTASVIKVLLMPWLYYNVENDQTIDMKQISDAEEEKIAGNLLADQKFNAHLHKYYKHVRSIEPFERVSMPENQKIPVFAGQKPPLFYSLSAIVCHSGSIQSGLYIAMGIKSNQDGTKSVYKFVDAVVEKISNPMDQLQFMMGSRQPFHGQQDTGGFVGYQYYYERAETNLQDIANE